MANIQSSTAYLSIHIPYLSITNQNTSLVFKCLCSTIFFFLWRCSYWKRGKKKRNKESDLVFLSSASSFLRCATSLELKEQKTFFLFLQSTLTLPSDFLRPQFPLPLRQGSWNSTLHDLGKCTVLDFTIALRLFFYC